MPRARLIDTDYGAFRRRLREATAAGAVLRPADGDRWEEYLQLKNVNHFGAMALAKGRFEGPAAVVLTVGGEEDGYYVYSEADEACMRLVFLE